MAPNSCDVYPRYRYVSIPSPPKEKGSVGGRNHYIPGHQATAGQLQAAAFSVRVTYTWYAVDVSSF